MTSATMKFVETAVGMFKKNKNSRLNTREVLRVVLYDLDNMDCKQALAAVARICDQLHGTEPYGAFLLALDRQA